MHWNRTVVYRTRVRFVAAISLLSLFVSSAAAQEKPLLQLIEPDPAARTAAAVIVSETPLVQTAQLFPVDAENALVGEGDLKRQLQTLFQRLESRLQSAEAGLAGLVRLNLYTSDDATAEKVLAQLPQYLPEGAAPAVTVASGKPVRAGTLVSLDALAISKRTVGRELKFSDTRSRSDFAEMADWCLFPPGTLVFISGQAEAGTDLRTATRYTLQSLVKSLEFLRLSAADVISTKSFAHPIQELPAVWSEFQQFYPGRAVPPAAFVEWISAKPSIEIELVAYAPQPETLPRPPGSSSIAPVVEYLTPPGMTASPVFSRVAVVRGTKRIYVGGLYGSDLTSPETEVRGCLDRLKAVVELAGSDLQHLAKATYYVSRDEPSQQLNLLRPTYYDPKRPPAASKAPTLGTGRAGYGLVIDMIAVGK